MYNSHADTIHTIKAMPYIQVLSLLKFGIAIKYVCGHHMLYMKWWLAEVDPQRFLDNNENRVSNGWLKQ